jgi:hypothetical protein
MIPFEVREQRFKEAASGSIGKASKFFKLENVRKQSQKGIETNPFATLKSEVCSLIALVSNPIARVGGS